MERARDTPRDTPAEPPPDSESGTARSPRRAQTTASNTAKKRARKTPRKPRPKPHPKSSGKTPGQPARRAPPDVVLCRSTDGERGYVRVRQAGGFAYLDRRGRPVKDDRVLARIASLAVPPAWEDVWICADPGGHLQATGRDARGRKQYRYHPAWRERREGKKFARIADFARALPRVRAAVTRDLALAGLPRVKVIAAIVRLLDLSLARIGGIEYARDNASYGLTTLRKRHLRLRARSALLSFTGKSGVRHDIEVKDASVRRVICACRRLPGADLFMCREHGELHRIGADDVNRYLRETGGCAITAKDFRIWDASAAALALLHDLEPPRAQQAEKVAVAGIIRQVAALLRNTPAVCRRSYVHPAVIDAWRTGSLATMRYRRAKGGMAPAERAFAALLCGLR